jgi:cytoskeletal protein RodZ
MFKSFWLTLLRFVGVMIVAVLVLFNSPLLATEEAAPRSASVSKASDRQVEAPNPSKPTTDKETTPDRSNQSAPAPSVQPTPQPSGSPYNMEKIKRFDDELYGT